MEQFYHELFQTSRQLPLQLRLHQGVINYVVLEHWHRSLELDFLIDCEAQFSIGGKKTFAKRGELILVNSGDIHALWPEKKVGRTQDELLAASLFISYDFLKELYPEFDEICFELEGNEEKKEDLRQIFKRLISVYQKEEGEFSYLNGVGLMYQMLYILFTYFKQEKNQAVIRSQKYVERLRNVMNYVEEHYKEPLTLLETADHFHVSMEYLARDFKKHTGSTFREFLDRVRFKKAFELLCSTDYSMLEIAMMSGFADARSFIKIFKKEYNMTPYQFKKNHQTSEEDRSGKPLEDYPHIVRQDS